MEKPILRMVEAIPMQERPDGQPTREGDMPLVVIRDPEELMPEPIVVPLPIFMIMAMCDGSRDLRDIQAEVTRETGQILPIDDLVSILEQLDENYLFENTRTDIRRETLERDYARLTVRPAVHAGTAYPADPAELRTFLDVCYTSPEGPLTAPKPTTAPSGLVVPHIDLRCGGPCMAWGYHELRLAEPPTLYIILGVAHQMTPHFFTLTEKDFDTPLGICPVNKAAAARLKELYGAERLEGEYAHKNEHSVEFQTVFLKHLHGDEKPFTILPLLCGSFHEQLASGDPAQPISGAEIGDFIEALKTLLAEFPGACIIAGVDLSHVGRKFGDERGVDDFRADLVRAADLRMLEQVAERNPEGFFDHFRPDQNARNVDAVGAVYTMLHALGGGEGRLLSYDQFREEETDSMVTYASMRLD